MKFDKFEGTGDKGKRSDYSDSVIGSTSSEANKRDASGKPDRNSLTKAIIEIEEKLQANRSRAIQIEHKLIALKGEVKGRYIQSDRYEALCKEQTELCTELTSLREDSVSLKLRHKRLQSDLHNSEGGGDRLDETNKLLALILKELRIMNRGKNE